MKRLKLAAAVLLIAASSATFAQDARPTPTPDEKDVVKITTALVQIDVTVTDRKGNIIRDLKPEEFEIFENGEKQPISNFSFVTSIKETASPAKSDGESQGAPIPAARLRPEQVRRTVALVVDDLNLSFESVHFVRRALRKYVDEQIQPGDLVAIIRTSGGIGALQQFTSDRRQLIAAIERIKWYPIANTSGAFAPIEGTPQLAGEQFETPGSGPGERSPAALQKEYQDFRRDVFSTGTLGALDYVIRGMQELPGRKSLMLVSDGFYLYTSNASGPPEISRTFRGLQALVDVANRASVVVYTMDARGLQPTAQRAEDKTETVDYASTQGLITGRTTELFDKQDGLVFLARETGGIAIINNNDLNGGIRRMLDDQSYYLLGYLPDTETFDPEKRRFNRLTVRVSRPDAVVRYRSGFFAAADAERAPGGPATAGMTITDALTSPFSANGVELTLNTVFTVVGKETYLRSFLHIAAKDLKFEQQPNGKLKAEFDILAMSFGDNGVPVDKQDITAFLDISPEEHRKIVADGFVYGFVFPVRRPGAYQMRVALRDKGSAKVGSANQFVEMPDLRKQELTLSGIILENLTNQQWLRITGQSGNTGAEITTDPLNDTSRRRFRRGTILRYGLEVFNIRASGGRSPKVTAQARIFRNGRAVFVGRDTPIDGGGSRSDTLPFAGGVTLGTDMEPDDYILQIVVTEAAGGKKRVASQFVQFEIVN